MPFTSRKMGATWLAMMLAVPVAQAQTQATWPQKPLKLVVAFPPGTPGDVLLRSMSAPLGEALGQPVVIENKPGAGGNVGSAAVLSAAPDAHTFINSPDTVVTVNPKIYSKPGFNPEQLLPVTTLGTINLMLACHPSLGVKTVAELTALAKSKNVTYASGGPGVPGHLAIEMYQSLAGTNMMHVPYKGPAPATVDLLAGQVGCAFLVTNQIVPHVKSGKLMGLAVSNRARSGLMPEVPTMHEAGITGFEATFAEVIWTAKGTPQPVIDRLQQEVAKLLKRPDIQVIYRAVDVTPLGDTPTEAAQRVATEAARWAPVIKRIGLKVE
jgi:tripartite-type tricarboxylate transporter receptor subunit TctC